MESSEKERLEDVDLETPKVDKNGGYTVDAQVKENPTVSQASGSGLCSRWTVMVHRIHQPILKVLLYITSIAASNPKRTIVAVITLSILLLVVGLLTNFEVDTDDDNVWTPRDSRPVQHEKWIDDESGFPEDNRYFHMMFHSEGGNVLSQGDVKRVFQAFDTVRGLQDYDAVCNASIYLDEFGDPACPIEGVTSFWNNSEAIFDSEVQSDDEAILAMSAEKYPNGEPVAEKDIMGFPERYVDGTLQSAQSYILRIEFPDNDDSKKFEDKALNAIIDLDDAWQAESNTNLRVEVSADRSFEDEFTRAIVDDIPLVPIVFVVMATFTSLVFWKKDKVQSRSLLGFGAVVTVLLSIMSGYGLQFIIGTPLTSMTQILPFVLFGVGLDDAFIICGGYDRTDPMKEAEDRIHATIKDIGISITMSTITTTLAFGIGCISSIPTVYWMCLYAFPTILLVYFYQATFFIAWIVLDDRRIKQKHRDCCWCVSVVEASDESEQENQEEPRRSPKEEASVTERFMLKYAEHLLRPWVKAAVILAFAALLCAGAISASQLTQSFSFTDVLPSDSYLTDFFDALDDYTDRSAISPQVYFRNVDQSDKNIQEQMESYINDLVIGVDAILEPSGFLWLSDFKVFVNNSEDSLAQFDFYDQVQAFLADPVYSELYREDIVTDGDGTITASRCRIDMDNIDLEDVKQQIDALEDQRKVTKAEPINQGRKDWAFFTFEGIYNIWEFYAVSVDELVITTITGVVAVTGVAFLLIPHLTAALFVLPLICMMYIDVLGVLQWAGAHVNPVSYIAMVMSIGLLVDYAMHVLLRYYESPGNRKEKTVEMLRTMGASILIAGTSTFLGTLPLAFSTSEIFTTVFYAFLGLVTVGCGHGLILLPVVLSIIGPEDRIEEQVSGDRSKVHTSETSSDEKDQQ